MGEFLFCYSTDMSVSKKTRKRLAPAERREQILEVAAKVFAEKGYRMTFVTDIVEGAGIGRGTFYLYFDSKKDVFIELVESYFRGFESLLKENRARLRNVIGFSGDVITTWRENLLRILEFHDEKPFLTTLVYGEVFAKDVDFSKRVDELLGLQMDHFLNELSLLQGAGFIRPCDPEVASAQLLGSVTYVLMVHMANRDGMDLDSLADEILEYHLRALVAPEVEKDVLAMLKDSRGLVQDRRHKATSNRQASPVRGSSRTGR